MLVLEYTINAQWKSTQWNTLNLMEENHATK